MRVLEFLVVAILCGLITCRSTLGQDSELSSRNPAIARDGKVTVNFGDLVIEVKPPRGRESIVNTRPIYEKWQNVDDVTYWESIYGSMDDIPAFEDLPEISGETIELKDVKEWEEENSNGNPIENVNKSQSEVSLTKTLSTKPLSIIRNSHPDRCERVNPLYSTQTSWSRQKRDTKETKEEEAESKESPKSDRKRKGRTLSLFQSGLGRPRWTSNSRSDYLLNKYGRKFFRPHKYGRGSSSVDDCIDDYGITGATRSEKFVDSAINAVELVNSGIAKTGQVVTETTVNAARQLAQTKHEVIDLGHQAVPVVALASLNNAADDCLEVGVRAAAATNIDSGLEVVGNSVLDTGSGIINADSDATVGIAASLDVGANASVDATVGSVVDSDAAVAAEIISNAVAKANSELVAAKAIKQEIAAVENDRQNDPQEAEIVGDALITEETQTQVEAPILESGVAISSSVDGAVEVASDTGATVGSALQTDADSKVGTSLNAGVSTSLNTDINVGKSHIYDNARRVLGIQDLFCECKTSLEDDRDREFYPRRRYYDDLEDEREYRRRFPGRSRYRPYSRDYYRRHGSGVHADAGIHSSLDAGVGVDSNLGSINTGTIASLGLDTNVDVGSSTNSGIRADAGINTSLNADLGVNAKLDSNLGAGRSGLIIPGGRRRIHGDFDDTCDCEDYEDYLEYRRRFLGRERGYHAARSGIHGDAELRASLDAGLGVQSNHGSIRTGTEASLDLESNLNTGTSTDSGILGDSRIRTSLDAGLNVNSNLDIAGTPLRINEGNRIYGDFGRNRDVCECEDSEEYREYRRRFPHGFRPEYRGLHNSGGRVFDSGIDLRTGGGITSGIHADSDIRSSLDADVGSNSNVAGNHLHAEGSASLGVESRLDIGRARSRRPDGIYRGYEYGEDISTEYDDYDDEREYGRFPAGRYRDRHRGAHSRIHADSGIRTSLDAGVDINAGSAGLRAGAKSSLDLDSHLDIGPSTLAVNGADPVHLADAINSAVRADGGIHTSLDTGLGISAGGESHGGITSSLDLDSHLDIGAGTNGAFGADRRSGIEVDANGPDGELGEKICEAACRETSGFRMHDSCPDSRFGPTGPDGLPYVCDNCRKRLYSGADGFCPNCGRQGVIFRERRPLLPSRAVYHFDGLKQLCKRTVNPAEGIEPHSRYKRGHKRYINLDANCTDDAFRQSLDCQGLDYSLETPKDGNPVSLGVVRSHLSHGHDIAMDMHDRARSLVAGGLHPCPHTPSMLHFFHSKAPDDLVKLNEESELTLFGTKLLQHKLSVDYNVTPNNFLEFLNHHAFRVTGNKICRRRQKRCSGYDKYRSLDGSCNNVAHPTWGQSDRAFARLLPARYSDGIHGMPVSVTGAELPNPRKLSIKLYSRSSKFDPELTLAVMQWGQALAHDLGRQVMDQTTSSGIECCADNGKRLLPKSLQHHSCAPITISPRDKFYSIHGQRCMNFVRSMTVCREDCTLGPADQLNGASSFLDCSPMYGADKTTLDELREFRGGRMKVEFRSGRWMLPTTTNHSEFCDIWTSDDVCYKTGDPRNNQNPQLVILQTMLVREHNRIAAGLIALNPQWDDERIFQESRRIVIAEYQHITYSEWLPLLLGRRYAKKHRVIRTEPGMSSAYNELINPTTIIGFTSGAFRSLHSMVEGDIGLWNIDGGVNDSIRLSDHYFRPKIIEKNDYFEPLLRGLFTQRMQSQDMNLNRELTEYLFRSRNDYGMDLAAIDIQRGRDHGVPSYNAYRRICRLEPAKDFGDLSNEISWENIEKLRRDYAHIDDVDLIVGATMENRVPGSQFGPTNRCLIGEQFYRSRVGDRYFYDNANLPHSFTPEQFHEITKVRLSRIMCDMGGAVGLVQRHAFRAISSKNPLVPCEDLPKLNLTLWKE